MSKIGKLIKILKLTANKTVDFFKSVINKIKENRMETGLRSSLLIMALLSLLCVVIQTVAQNGFNAVGYLSLICNPFIILFNFIPVYLVMIMFYCVFAKIWVSFFLTDTILMIALFVNHYKIMFRAESFKFIDVALFTEAMNITQNYTLTFSPRLFLLVVISIVLLLVTLGLFKDRKLSLIKRMCTLIVVFALMFSSYAGIYSNKEIYKSVKSFAGEFNELSIIANKGLIYSFISGINDYAYPVPEEYHKDKPDDILTGYEDIESEYKPNVVAIMSEAFFNMEECENAEFYEGKEPLVNFKKIKNDAMWGDMIVPGFAGSTASTEFEFLTGNNVSLISKALPPPYNTYITKSVFSLADMFKSMGYYALGIHPGHNWFYNRESAYVKMGFDDFITIEDIPRKLEQVNYYASDKEATALIIDNYKKHLEEKGDMPYFSFTVTIQNHGPYPKNKTYDEKRYVQPEGMNDELYNTINNYAEGLYNADELLGSVYEYINSLDKPTYLVFFGDHLPYLETEGYDYLGYDIASDTQEALIRKFKVPYIICANDAAKNYMKENGLEIKNGEQKLISSNFLSAKLIEYMQASRPAFYQFLSDVSEKINVIAPRYYIEDGVPAKTLSPSASELLNNYSIMQYKNLKEYEK